MIRLRTVTLPIRSGLKRCGYALMAGRYVPIARSSSECQTSAKVSDEYVLDTPRVREFVTGVQAAIAAADSAEQACEAIRPAFADLLADQTWLPDELAAPVPGSGMGGGIGQWALYRSDDGSLSLFALVVPPEAQTPVHDHLAWGLVGLYRGTQDEEIFARRGETLELAERRALVPGDFY